MQINNLIKSRLTTKFFRKIFIWLAIGLLFIKGVLCCVSLYPCYWTPLVIKTTPTFSEFSRHIAVEDEYQKSKCAVFFVKKENLPSNFRMKIVVDNPTTASDTVLIDMSTYNFWEFHNEEGKKVKELSGPNHPIYIWRMSRETVKGFTVTFIPTKDFFTDDIKFEIEYQKECYSL